jgi:hypothetical protein
MPAFIFEECVDSLFWQPDITARTRSAQVIVIFIGYTIVGVTAKYGFAIGFPNNSGQLNNYL